MSNNKSSFNNNQILSWLDYFSQKAGLDIEKIKLIDISRRKKNLIPTIETHKRVVVLIDEGHPGFFFDLWESGLGDCELWFKTGLTPEGEVRPRRLADMIDTEISEPSVMLIVNPVSGPVSVQAYRTLIFPRVQAAMWPVRSGPSSSISFILMTRIPSASSAAKASPWSPP